VSNLQLKVKSWGIFAYDKRAVKALLRGAANDIKSKTARLIARTSGSGRVYRGGGGAKYRGTYKAGHYQASAPGEPPVQVSGTLKGSLKSYVYKDGDGFAVRERAFYALFLEAGALGGRPGSRAKTASARRQRRKQAPTSARVLEPRPSLDVVMEGEAKNLEKRLTKAFDEGLTWRQTQ
jgi:hypothetical protein